MSRDSFFRVVNRVPVYRAIVVSKETLDDIAASLFGAKYTVNVTYLDDPTVVFHVNYTDVVTNMRHKYNIKARYRDVLVYAPTDKAWHVFTQEQFDHEFESEKADQSMVDTLVGFMQGRPLHA